MPKVFHLGQTPYSSKCPWLGWVYISKKQLLEGVEQIWLKKVGFEITCSAGLYIKCMIKNGSCAGHANSNLHEPNGSCEGFLKMY